ncbi:MAG: alpha/beta fold hydrolase [Actinobacteria bacterium]|nr:alpha/beta fold hydrolase [Actinomycetota bacterium]
MLPVCNQPQPRTPIADRETSPSQVNSIGSSGVFDAAFRQEILIDRARTTPQNGSEPEKQFRQLTTWLFYPVKKGFEGAGTEALPPEDGGSFPLVVFAHGLTGQPASYQGLLLSIAGAGYVVAAPDFPLTSGNTQGKVNTGDAPNQIGDLAFVIDQIEEFADRKHPLGPGVSTENVGASGHSFGAGTAAAIAHSACCSDPRVTASILYAGVDPRSHGFPGVPFDKAKPLLMIHGSLDNVDSALSVFREAKPPKLFLTLEEADHFRPYIYRDPSQEGHRGLTAEVSILFLDWLLKGKDKALAQLTALVEQNRSLGSLEIDR